MLHPVGPMPAAVYWRRRLLVLGLLVALVGGGSWVGSALIGGRGAPAEAATVQRPAGGPPALDQVVPSPAAVQLPGSSPQPTGQPAGQPAGQAAGPAAPADGGPCTDDMIDLQVRPQTPSAPAGTAVTVELVVTNTSPVACTRALDPQLQEVVLLDGSGARLWGSNDCQPASSSDTRTLAPGQAVAFPVRWTGRTSQPGCTAARTTPAPGDYVLRGRLDTETTGDVMITLT